MKLKEIITKILPEIIQLRRDFHQNPELSQQEYDTKEKIVACLNAWDIPYQTNDKTNSIVAFIQGKKKGRTVALRGDMDALPINEETGLPFASQNANIMHACGHDFHTAILLGAGKAIKMMENEIKGNVKFFFQPAEETVGGAKKMIDEGCLKNPVVDMIFGLHVDPEVECGKISVKYGRSNASSDSVIIKIIGKSTHGAYPHLGIDPIFISGTIITGIQSLISRFTKPQSPVVFTIGKIRGGTKANVIPDEVVMECTLRTHDNETRNHCKQWIQNYIEHTALSFGAHWEVIIEEGYPPLINHDPVVDLVVQNGRSILGEPGVLFRDEASLGAEDFAYFTQTIPGCFFTLGCGNREKDCIYPLHSSQFKGDEDCISIGIELQTANVLKFLNL